MARVLSSDWEQAYGHPVYFLETFVDPQRFRGTCYRVANSNTKPPPQAVRITKALPLLEQQQRTKVIHPLSELSQLGSARHAVKTRKNDTCWA